MLHNESPTQLSSRSQILHRILGQGIHFRKRFPMQIGRTTTNFPGGAFFFSMLSWQKNKVKWLVFFWNFYVFFNRSRLLSRWYDVIASAFLHEHCVWWHWGHCTQAQVLQQIFSPFAHRKRNLYCRSIWREKSGIYPRACIKKLELACFKVMGDHFYWKISTRWTAHIPLTWHRSRLLARHNVCWSSAAKSANFWGRVRWKHGGNVLV